MHNNTDEVKVLSIENFTLNFIPYKTTKINKIKTPIFLLKDICLSLFEGSLFLLTGSSGSGKSLLCHAIVDINFFRKSSFQFFGEILYDDKNFLEQNQKDYRTLIKQNFYFIPQDPTNYFDPLYTIENQLYANLKLTKTISEKSASELFCDSFNKFHITNTQNILKSYPHMLSRGTLQRILISLCYMKNPKIIIADEATSALDPLSCQKVWTYFIEFMKSGGSILLVTHTPERIISDRCSIGIMSDGKLSMISNLIKIS